MAAYISIPRDLTRVKSKVFFGLTKRQLVCFGAAALIGVPAFFLMKRSGNTSLAVMGMICLCLPLFFLAMYEKVQAIVQNAEKRARESGTHRSPRKPDKGGEKADQGHHREGPQG